MSNFSKLFLAVLLMGIAIQASAQTFTITAEQELPKSIPAGGVRVVTFKLQNRSVLNLLGVNILYYPADSGFSVDNSSSCLNGLAPKDSCLLVLKVEAPQKEGDWFKNKKFEMCFKNVVGACKSFPFESNWSMTVTPATNPPPEKYTVRAEAGSHGSISPDSQEYIVGETDAVTFKVTPDANFKIDQVTDSCHQRGTLSGDTYSVSNVTADCKVSARFVEIPVDGKPEITSVESFATGEPSGPLQGKTGIYIRGKNFPVGKAIRVKIGNNWASDETIESPTLITANTPVPNATTPIGTAIGIALYQRNSDNTLEPLADRPAAYTYRKPRCDLQGAAERQQGVTYCQAEVTACIYVPTEQSRSFNIKVEGKLMRPVPDDGKAPQCVDAFPKFGEIPIPKGETGIFCTQPYPLFADRETTPSCNLRARLDDAEHPINLTMLSLEYRSATEPNSKVDQAVIFGFTSHPKQAFLLIADPAESYQGARSFQLQSHRVYSPQHSQAGFCIVSPESRGDPPDAIPGENYCLNPGFYGLSGSPWIMGAAQGSTIPTVDVLDAESQLIH